MELSSTPSTFTEVSRSIRNRAARRVATIGMRLYLIILVKSVAQGQGLSRGNDACS